MSRRVILFALLGALVLAGCASNTGSNTGNSSSSNNGNGNSGATAPSAPSVDEARALLAGATSDAPQQYGLDMSFKDVNGTQAMTAKGSVDNVTKTSYFEMTFDPSVYKSAGASAAGADMSAFANGIAVYSSKDGSAFIVNGTAIVSETNSSDKSSGSTSNPFGSFLSNPEQGAAFLADKGVNITKVEGVVWHNQPAIRLTIQDTQEGQSVTGTATIYTATKRLAHIDANLPASKSSGSSSADLGSFMEKGGTMSMDLLYGNEATVTIPEKAQRAVGLLYKSDHAKFSFGGSSQPKDETWTFQHASGIPLSELQAVVPKTSESSSSMSGMGMPSMGGIDEDWHMGLAEGTKTVNGVTLTFTDADHDGKLSKGDTLKISTTNTDSNGDPGALPGVVLKDTKTGLYVTPGFEVFALVGGAALVALVLRRRG